MINNLILILGILSLSVNSVFAYDASTTHEMLTENSIRASVQKDGFSSLDFKAVTQGSIREDDGYNPRNHSYDPINNDHWLNGPSVMTAKEWASHTYFNDYDWKDDIYYFVSGQKDKAMDGLGRIAHLIQDMSVPDHTRLDKHLNIVGYNDSSPYETYTSRFTATNTDLIAKYPGITPISLPTLGDYFDQLATYSNKNFYSKDTIESLNYSIINPEIKNETLADGKVHTFAWTRGDDKYRLYEIATTTCPKKKACKFSKTLTEPVLSDYWQRLAPKAVAYSAGVINLFFQEAEKAKVDYVAHQESLSWFDKLIVQIKDNINAAQDLVREEMRSLAQSGDKAGAKEKKQELEGLKDLERAAERANHEVTKTERQIEEGKLSLWDYLKLGVEEGQQLLAALRAFAATHGNLAAVLLNFETKATSTPPIAPVITSPTLAQLTQTFATSTIEFAGTAATGTTILNTFNSLTASTSASGTWNLILTGLPDGTTTFSFITQNEHGTSSPTQLSVVVNTVPVVPARVRMKINEIAWHGTASSTPEDKFIELKLSTDRDISLGNYALIVGSTTIPLVGQLLVDNDRYYVIERGDDQVISDYPADSVANFDINPMQLDMRLVRAEADGSTTDLDVVNFSTSRFCNNYDDCPWKYYDTLERATYDKTNSNNDAYWSDWTAERSPSGLSRNGEAIIGTPGRENMNYPTPM